MRVIGRLGGLLLLVAAVALAAAVPVGLAARGVARYRRPALPQQVLDPVTDQVTRVFARDGRTQIASFYDEDRHDVALGQIAPVMRQAIVAAEDARFYQHGGVDVRGVLRALVADAHSGSAGQGASTLTMQLVRNAIKNDPSLTPAGRAAATADTPERKLREAEYAVELEQRLSKQQILQNYLNIAYFGDGAYGIDAASRRFFGVAPAKLTLAQAALIAGVVQSPDSDNPVTGDRGRAHARQLYVLAAMVKAGMITQAEATAATARKLTFTGTPTASGCPTFFCDYLKRWWAAQPDLGNLQTGGYTIVTTLDPAVQEAADRESRSVYAEGNRKALPIAVVQPGTGHVLALAVNRQYGTKARQTVDPLVSGGGGVHGYPAGSTFKLFTMLAALQAGMPLDTGFDAPAKLVTHWSDHGPGNCAGKYCPGNDNPAWMDGPRTMWSAFGRSVNTYFVHLEEQVGPAAAVAAAENLGISFSAPNDKRLAAAPDGWGAFTLGVADTTPLELASAYATLAADGRYCAPTPVLSITSAAGRAIGTGDECRQALPPDVARAAVDAARCPVGEQGAWHQCDGGTAQQVKGIFGGRPVAGKTGSTEDNTTETFVGFTPAVAAAGIANDPRDPSDHVGSGVESRVVTAVARTLREAARDSGYPDFRAPSPEMAFG